MFRNIFIFLILGLSASGCRTENRERVVIYAASSLTDVLGVLENHFDRDHPNIEIATAFAGSQTLRMQIHQGAPADVFISANREHMTGLVTQGRVSGHHNFAYNRLAVVVPTENPAGIEAPADMVKANLLVMGNPQVPIGRYARQWLSKMNDQIDPNFSTKVLGQVVSLENNVRVLRAKVELGEADAAIVYLTDALSSRDLQHIPIEPEANIRAVYQLGIVSRETVNSALDVWLDFLNSAAARELMKQEGLELP